MGPGWVVWAKAPDRFEAGTPAIVNVIAFAIALGAELGLSRQEIQQGLAPLILRVKVRRVVLVIVHPNHDAKEHRDYRHPLDSFLSLRLDWNSVLFLPQRR